jgi:hypothetical protein
LQELLLLWKVCAFGKGKCSALFFKKGKPEIFLKTEITMKDIIPDFLTFIFPSNWWICSSANQLFLVDYCVISDFGYPWIWWKCSGQRVFCL